MRHFVILIGGPSTFISCDKQHDQTWNNYVVPPQMACMTNSVKLAGDEQIHWVVYANPYEFRWDDDSVITKDEKKQDDGSWLHSLRKNAAAKVKGTGARSYLDRIKMIAAGLGAQFKSIRTPQEFWDYLAALPKASISRVWYFGHAAGNGLMLSLSHNASCGPSASLSDMILVKEIPDRARLVKDRFDPATKQTSRFYGCYTNGFAQEWHKLFKVPTEGAQQKIDFGVVNRASNIPDLLERIQSTPTSEGNPVWTRN